MEKEKQKIKNEEKCVWKKSNKVIDTSSDTVYSHRFTPFLSAMYMANGHHFLFVESLFPQGSCIHPCDVADGRKTILALNFAAIKTHLDSLCDLIKCSTIYATAKYVHTYTRQQYAPEIEKQLSNSGGIVFLLDFRMYWKKQKSAKCKASDFNTFAEHTTQ